MKRLYLRDCEFGKGVFAADDIKPGEVILRFEGPVVRVEELPWPYSAENDHYLQVGEGVFIGPSGQIDDYVNHSCSPNSAVFFLNGAIKLVAIKPICAGTEITFDYSTTMDSQWCGMNCGCGCKNCRGKVENFLDLPLELQLKYVRKNIVPDFILHKLTESKSSQFQECLTG